MAYEGFSYLQRGEDGIWRRRYAAKRGPAGGDRHASGAHAFVPNTEHHARDSASRSRGFQPRPPSRDKPGTPAGGPRSNAGYHLRRVGEPSGSQHYETATGAAASKVYGRLGTPSYQPARGYSPSPSPYLRGHALSVDSGNARPSTVGNTFGIGTVGSTSNYPHSPSQGTRAAAYAAAGIQFRGNSGKQSRYPASPSAGAATTGQFAPSPPSSSQGQRSPVQHKYQFRRAANSAPGDHTAQYSRPGTSERPRGPVNSAAWADGSDVVGPRHTSLTLAKIVADLSHSQKSKESHSPPITPQPASPSGGQGSSQARSGRTYVTRQGHPEGEGPQSPSTPTQPSPPFRAVSGAETVFPNGGRSPPAYGRPKHASSPAASAGQPKPYERAQQASADGYRKPQQPATQASAAPEPGEFRDTMGMIPGYSISSLLGEGGFCQVRLGLHHLSSRKVAIKMIDKSKLTDTNDRRRVAREIKVLKRMKQENVIKLFEVIDSPAHIYIVMERAANGSLLDYVRTRKRLSERDACWFLKQIIHGLDFCHRAEVVHRDIKLENILLDHSNRLKIIDFGLSTFIQPGKLLRVHCGSPSYAAPEIVGRKLYDGPPVDIWSTGVVLFAMIAGYLPFHAQGNKQELCQKIMRGVFKPPDYMSMEARDLISRMLTLDPAERITIPEILDHPWVRSGPDYETQIDGGIYNIQQDPRTGAVKADDTILREMEGHGFDSRKTLDCLMRNDCNYISATYFLLAEEKAESERHGKQSSSHSCSSSSSAQQAAAGSVPHAGGPATAPTQPKQVVVGNWDGRDDSAIAMHHKQQQQQPTAVGA